MRFPFYGWGNQSTWNQDLGNLFRVMQLTNSRVGNQTPGSCIQAQACMSYWNKVLQTRSTWAAEVWSIPIRGIRVVEKASQTKKKPELTFKDSVFQQEGMRAGKDAVWETVVAWPCKVFTVKMEKHKLLATWLQHKSVWRGRDCRFLCGPEPLLLKRAGCYSLSYASILGQNFWKFA